MKKTWTTRILIALLTLAMVVGVFGIAPREAQALDYTINGGPASNAVPKGTTGATVTFFVTPTEATQWYSFNGAARQQSNEYVLDATTAGSKEISCVVYDAQTDGNTLGTATRNIYVYTVPTGVQAALPTTPTVGTALSGASFTAQGDPNPACTYTKKGTWPAEYSLNTSTGAVTGTPKTAGSVTLEVTASNGYDAKDGSMTFSVGKGAAAPITITPESPSVAVNEPITLTADSANTDGVYSWKAGTITGTGKSFTFTPSTAGTVTVEVKQGAGTNYLVNDTGTTKDVTVTAKRLTVTINQPTSGSYASGTTVYLRGTASVTEGTTYNWTQSGGANAITDPTNATGAAYVISDADIGKTITFKLTAKNSSNSDGSATVSINVYNDDTVTSPTTSSLSFNSATLYDTQTFYATTSRGGQMKISNSNPAIATVTAGGQTIGTTAVAIANNTQVTVKAVAYGRTYIDIVPTNGASSNGKRVTVYVGSQTPTLDVQFWSSDNCTTTLSKVYNWGTLKVSVDNYNPQYPYVTITRANIRTYVQGGSYYSHPSTYTYTAALTQDLNDPLKATATLYVIPQYNGTTHYTAAYTGAVSKNSPTVYVTGYTTLPQTGPNYIWAYVLGGLCLLTVATAVTLNVRKKKRESI